MIKTWQEWAEIHEHLMGPLGLPAKLSLMQREIDQLREALAKQEQGEPVAWMYESVCGNDFTTRNKPPAYAKNIRPLGYTTPQQRKPLTEEQLIDLWPSLIMHQHTYAFARAIEAAHGIK
jgi:hypothetical protein